MSYLPILSPGTSGASPISHSIASENGTFRYYTRAITTSCSFSDYSLFNKKPRLSDRVSTIINYMNHLVLGFKGTALAGICVLFNGAGALAAGIGASPALLTG